MHFVSREIYEQNLQRTNDEGPTNGLYDPTSTEWPVRIETSERVGKWGTASGIQPLTPDLINNKTVDAGKLRLSGEMPIYNFRSWYELVMNVEKELKK